LGCLLAFMVYIHATVGVYFVLLGVFTLIFYGWRAALRWIYPVAVLVVLILPEALHKYTLLVGSRLSGFVYETPPFVGGMIDYFQIYWGRAYWAWTLMVGVAVCMLLWRGWAQRRLLVGVLLWLLMPLLLYVTNEWLVLFIGRYTLWYLTGFALAVGWGLSLLPRWGQGLGVATLLVVSFAPMSIKQFDQFGENLGASMNWLAENYVAGDVVVVDPSLSANEMREEWDLYARIFFPQGLPLQAGPGEAQRVWYVTGISPDTQTETAVAEGRIAKQFFGELPLLIRLWEGPPDADGILFENGMRYHGAQLFHEGEPITRHLPMFHEGETVTVRLWWSVVGAPERDYSVGLYAMDGDSNVLSSVDSAPQTISLAWQAPVPPPETSRWEPGQYYVEEREIIVPPGSERIALTVYQWWDGERMAAPGVDRDQLLTVTPVGVMYW